MEYRRRCNVCGKLFCYTDEDLEKSKNASGLSTLSTLGSIFAAFSGDVWDSYAMDAQAERDAVKVIDYTKCPSCNSKDTVLINQPDNQITMGWACAYCGYPVNDKAKFCRMCGKPIMWPNQSQNKYCIYCGNMVSSTAKYCKICGNPLRR